VLLLLVIISIFSCYASATNNRQRKALCIAVVHAAIRLTVACLLLIVNIYYTSCDLSVRSRAISMNTNMCTNIGHWRKSFQGQRSKIRVIAKSKNYLYDTNLFTKCRDFSETYPLTYSLSSMRQRHSVALRLICSCHCAGKCDSTSVRRSVCLCACLFV